MRQEVLDLIKLGPLPDENADAERIDQYAELLEKVERPVTDQEAQALLQLFGPDDCYGVAWSMLHLIETAPGWPLEESLKDNGNQWILTLRRRAENARKYSSTSETADENAS